MHAHVDAANHQDPVFQLDFAHRLGNQPLIGRIDLARLQRAPEGSRKSAGGAGDYVIEGRRARRESIRGNLVMFGDGSVHAENHRLLFGGEERAPDGPLDAFNTDRRAVDD
jgi:hypothetical protein